MKLESNSQDLFRCRLDDAQRLLFDQYRELLQDWNQRMNITSLTSDEEIEILHFFDSIVVLDYANIKPSAKLIDIGTGGGFPGIPLKIMRDDLRITLMDSLLKRIHFLQAVIMELKLTQIEALHKRAEEMAKEDRYRQKYDIAISRAVANLSTLLEYALPFVKVGGFFIAMKGPNCRKELTESRNAIQLLGGKLEGVYEYQIPGSDIGRSIVIVKKIASTDKKYPRGGGMPRKKPL